MGASDPLTPEIQGCLVLGAPKKQAWQNHLPKSQRGIRMYREPAMTNLWPCPAALGECPELGIAPGLGSRGQIVSRKVSSMIFCNCHWALDLQPLWCQ